MHVFPRTTIQHPPGLPPRRPASPSAQLLRRREAPPATGGTLAAISRHWAELPAIVSIAMCAVCALCVVYYIDYTIISITSHVYGIRVGVLSGADEEQESGL